MRGFIVKLRVAGDTRFPGFKDVRGRVRVLDHGRKIEKCVAVDTTTGVAWRYATKPDGTYQFNAAGDDIVIERVFGSFRVEHHDGGAYAH